MVRHICSCIMTHYCSMNVMSLSHFLLLIHHDHATASLNLVESVLEKQPTPIRHWLDWWIRYRFTIIKGVFPMLCFAPVCCNCRVGNIAVVLASLFIYCCCVMFLSFDAQFLSLDWSYYFHGFLVVKFNSLTLCSLYIPRRWWLLALPAAAELLNRWNW